MKWLIAIGGTLLLGFVLEWLHLVSTFFGTSPSEWMPWVQLSLVGIGLFSALFIFRADGMVQPVQNRMRLIGNTLFMGGTFLLGVTGTVGIGEFFICLLALFLGIGVVSFLMRAEEQKNSA